MKPITPKRTHKQATKVSKTQRSLCAPDVMSKERRHQFFRGGGAGRRSLHGGGVLCWALEDDLKGACQRGGVKQRVTWSTEEELVNATENILGSRQSEQCRTAGAGEVRETVGRRLEKLHRGMLMTHLVLRNRYQIFAVVQSLSGV